jgi:hypothetical protein
MAIFNSYVKLPEGSYPLVMTNSLLWKMAIEIVDLPVKIVKDGDFP